MRKQYTDPADELLEGVEKLVKRYRKQMEGVPMGSKTLGYAVAAGLPVRRAYSVSDMSRITGLPYDLINGERRAGRIRCVAKAGSEKGFYVPVDEMDRWFEGQMGDVA